MEYKRIPLGPLWTNSFTFWDSDGIAFTVDPGGDPSDLLRFLESNGLTLRRVFLTHGHADHLLGVPALCRATGATVVMPRGDAGMAGDSQASLAVMLGAEQSPFQPDETCVDGDCFDCGAFHLTCLSTPGHTAGSSCYLVEQGGERVLVAGDTLFARSIGRTDLPGGDEEAMKRSLARLKNLPGDMIVLPGHGPETTLEAERLHNPFLRD